MAAYDVEQWSDLFVAAAGAGAALAGLVFVAVSINIERILAYEGLPERALETVLTLLVVVLVAIVGLIPAQSNTALGLEVLGIALSFSIVIGRLSNQELPPGAPRRWVYSRMAMRAIAAVPLLVGGLSLIFDTGGGLYWIVAGLIGAIVGAVANAWVLLVEILR
jgi:hypothetical protein